MKKTGERSARGALFRNQPVLWTLYIRNHECKRTFNCLSWPQPNGPEFISGVQGAEHDGSLSFLSASNFFQDWSNTALISASDNWSGVPSIQGFRGDNLTALTGADPQTLLADDASGVLDVNANQTNPNTFSTGGVTEFEIANPTVALAGSGTADAPYIVLYLDASGRSNVNLSFNARDIDGSGDDATQQIAVHYRIGESGDWINLPAGYLADASTGPNLADASTPVSFSLPTQVNGQAQVQVRIMSTNAAGNDEWIGIDDISVTSQASSSGPTMSITPLDADRVEGDSGRPAFTFTVSRTDSTGAASVNYSVAGAGADPAAAADFAGNALPSGIVNFADGQSSVTLTILVAGDAVSETNEGFQVTLQLPSSGYTLASATANGLIRNDDPIAIYTIQGAGHISSFNGQAVTTEGVVTALSFNGYYLQDATGDGNDATSDGIFVFTGSAPPATLTVGETVRLTGTVTEFQPNGNANNLRLTELTNPTILSESNNVTAIAPVVIGAGGRQPSQTVIDNDGFTVFDPAQDAIDFWESLEGMLVTVPSPVAIGGTSQFASGSFFNEEIWVVPQGSFDASSQNARGGLTIEPDDFNPERIQIDDMDRVLEFPQVTTGDRLSDITGVVNYDFGNFEILVSTAPTVITPSNLARETTTLVADSREITIAGYNVENLDPNDSDGDTDIANGKFAAIAAQIANNLAGPMVVALQEVQDSSGSQNNGVIDADLTASTLIAAISAAGGPAYTYADIAPVNNTGGGQPGGNIRTGFLYNAAEVTLVRMEQITDPAPGETDAYAGDDFGSSRLPLVGFFERNGVEFIVINVHLNSKGGDGGLFGDDQPPVLTSELQRNEQARVIRDYIQGLLATDPAANIMLIGDVNDFSWSLPGQTLLSSPMTDLADHLIADPVERYSFNFQGNAQELDHTMVSDSLRDNFVAAFDIVHVNSEFSASNRASDHDPGITLLDFRNASETLLAAIGGEFIDGAGGNDFITGQGGNDTFNGGAGNDTLVGGGGNDFFVASQGNDSVDGGAGANDALDAFLAASGVTFDFASMSGGLTAGNVSGI